MLDFDMLHRLQVLASCASFTKAAEALYITRSALIQQINSLEKECGFEIFSRSFKGVKLTEAGNKFLQDLSRIANNYDRTIMQCQELSNKNDNRIVIGSLPNFSTLLVPKICSAFCKKHHQVEIQFKDFFTDNYFASFQKGEFDICVEYMINYHNDSREIVTLNFYNDKYACCVAPGSLLAQKECITFDDLKRHKIMMYKKGITECDDALREQLLACVPHVRIIDLDNYDSSIATRCILEDAVVMAYSMYAKQFTNLVTLPVSWDIPIKIGLGYHKRCRPIVKEFVETAKELYSNNELL